MANGAHVAGMQRTALVQASIEAIGEDAVALPSVEQARDREFDQRLRALGRARDKERASHQP